MTKTKLVLCFERCSLCYWRAYYKPIMTHLNPYLVLDCTIMDTNKEEIGLVVLSEKHRGK